MCLSDVCVFVRTFSRACVGIYLRLFLMVGSADVQRWSPILPPCSLSSLSPYFHPISLPFVLLAPLSAPLSHESRW